MSKIPTVIIPINRGHLARLLVYSGVITRLGEMGCRVVILTPEGEESPLKQVIGSANVTFDRLPRPGIRLSYRWDKVYRYFFHTIIPTSSSAARLEWIAKTDPRRYRLITGLSPRTLERMRRLWVGVRRQVFRAGFYRSVFKKHRPDLVVTGSMARSLEEHYLLRYASAHGIPSLCTVQSWDQITTKEWLLEKPDRLAVWSPANKREAVQWFGFAEEDVVVTGVPQFDFYFKPETFEPRQDWLARHGLDPHRQVIFVSAGAAIVHQNLPNVLDTLIEAMETNQFVAPAQILIRPHPAVYFGDTPGHGREADLQQYEALHPLIKANRPRKSDARIASDTAYSEHIVLANNLYHASVVVDFYGTVSIEAAMVDRPVVEADVRSSFAANPADPYPDGIDYSRYEHLRYILSMKGSRVAYNRRELIDFINAYLEDPSRDREGRRRVTEAFCPHADGRSTERMAQTIADCARGIWPPRI